MKPLWSVLAGLAIVEPVSAQVQVVPRAGLVITSSAVFKPGTYRVPTADTLVVVRGSDVLLDLTGVHLVGASEEADPDRAAGVAILVDGGANITIRNGRIRGFKVAILARGTRNLRLLDNDLSFNWKPRLYSIVEHESLADWLSFHNNEKDEWLRFGAAMYLSRVRGGEVRGNTVHQGMNALLMTGSDSVLVWNNDFSFNSGLGVGMYRSNHNRIMHNQVDYNVRGYSEGFYRRGQDSAGILIYQQSDSNVVAFNSATHSGDGLFLWAGQHTMDTGQGGANDNLFFGNDFSWAPTNGMEATFSRNVFVNNIVRGSDYGLWGGYSYGSLVLANRFERNRIGVAIEHGQENRILGNRFHGDSTVIQLWANRIEPSDWGYPKHRDTRSRDYQVRWNVMTGGGGGARGARVGFRVSETANLDARSNVIRADTLFVSRGDTTAVLFDTLFAGTSATVDSLLRRYAVAPLPNAAGVLPSAYADWPRSTIIVDEWGPYDWRSPKLWPVDSSLSRPVRLRVLGPRGAGTWRLLRARAASVSKQRGSVGDTIIVIPESGRIEDWEITLEYRGSATRSPRGAVRPVNGPYVFGYSRFDARPVWDVKVYAWTDGTHPLDSASAFAALLRGERGVPALRRQPTRLDYMWYRPRIDGWPQNRAGIVATTSVDLPAGRYAIRTISDDGIRVYVDDELAIEDWSIHESRVHEAPLLAGKRRIRVEYFQRDGWTELRAEILKRAGQAP